MKKLIPILASGLALAACAAETPVPPTVTPLPPTATSIRDRGVEFPSASSLTTERPATRTPKPKESQTGSPITLGKPTTSTPKPTELPLGERYVAHFADKGFEYVPSQDRYMKTEGRLVLVIMAVDGERQMVGYIIPEPLTSEEIDIVRDHLREAADFLDPDFGWRTIGGALDAMSSGSQDGTVWFGGRSVVYITSGYGSLELGTAGTSTSYTFLAEGQLIYEGD